MTVVALSVIKHVIDDEVIDCSIKTCKMLVSDEIAMVSFLTLQLGTSGIVFQNTSQHRHGHGNMLSFTTEGVLRGVGEWVCSSSVQFVNGDSNLSISGVPSKLLNVLETAQTFRMGQSLCAMRI